MEILRIYLEEQLLLKYYVKKHLKLRKIQNMIDIKEDLLQWFINSGDGIKNENILDQKLAEELHKPFTRKLEKRKVHSWFIDNIWGADLADMQLISKYNKGICFFILCY